jgi:hypothetical protein
MKLETTARKGAEIAVIPLLQSAAAVSSIAGSGSGGTIAWKNSTC